MPVPSLAFSPAGDLAVAQDASVHLVVGGRTVTIAIGDQVTCVAFRDAFTLAIASEARLSILGLGNGPPQLTRIRHECTWSSMLWSPDGKYIVGGQYEPWVDVVDVARKRQLRMLDPDEFDDEGRTALAFIGDTLYSTAYNKLVRWRWPDVVANKERCRNKTGITGHAHVLGIGVLADGTLMTLVDFDEQRSFLQRFAPTGEKLGKRIDIERTERMAVMGDQLVLAYTDDVWVASLAGEKLRDLAIDHAALGEIRALAVHGDRIAVGGSLGYQLIAP